MDLAPDFDEFIGSLIANEVEFLIVGAYALASADIEALTPGEDPG